MKKTVTQVGHGMIAQLFSIETELIHAINRESQNSPHLLELLANFEDIFVKPRS